MLGHGALDGEDRVVRTPTLLPSMVGILISSVSAGCDFKAAVLAAGTVYTWGVGGGGCLSHGNEGCSLVPKQVLCCSWGKTQLRGDSIRQALHVGLRRRWAARAQRHSGSAGATAR